MTNPQDPSNQEGAGREHYGNPQYPAYPPSNHPEDQPNFGQSSGSYGQANYGSQGNDQHAYEQPTYGQPGGDQYPPQGYPSYDNYGGYGNQGGAIHPDFDKTIVISDEGPDILASIKYGFSATFRRPLLWIVGSLVFMVIFGLLQFVPVLNAVGAVLTAMIMPIVYKIAVLQIEAEPIERDRVTQGYSWGRAVVVGLAANILIMLVSALFFWPLIGYQYGDQISTEAIIAAAGGMIAYLILTIFLQFAVLFVVDQDVSFGEAFKGSCRIARTWFWKILGWNITLFFFSFLILLFTLMIGVIIVLPVVFNATTYIYRQMAQRPFPDFAA